MLRALAERSPLTPSGLTALVLCGVALRYGAARQDLVLTIGGTWGLAVAALAGLAALLEALRVRRELRRSAAGPGADRLQLIESRPLLTGLRLPKRWRPLAAEPTWSWVSPPASVRLTGQRTLNEVVVPGARALATFVRRRVVVEDIFGLWRVVLRQSEPRATIVLPHAGALREADVATCLASGDLLSHPYGPAHGDRVDFRTYTRSDPARLILWKVYARTRQLLVRTPEPARTPETRPLVYLVAGAGDDAAAGVARLLMESGVLGPGARFATDGAPDPVTGTETIRESLVLSVGHRHRGGEDLAAALASDTVEDGDPVVLVCPASDGPWSRRIVHQLARRPDRFLVLAAADGRASGRDRPLRDRLLWRSAADRSPGVTPASMLRACRPLVGTGSRVVLIDRKNGSMTQLAGAWSSDEALAAVAGAGA